MAIIATMMNPRNCSTNPDNKYFKGALRLNLNAIEAQTIPQNIPEQATEIIVT
jgi:hypothetical protein